MKHAKALKAKGFTLVELLVVLAILAVLAALIYPVFSTASREGRLKITATNRLHQTSLAINLYRGDDADRFPPNIKALMKSSGLPEEMFYCPRSGLQFWYPLTASVLASRNSRMPNVVSFEESKNAVLKALFFHNFDCGAQGHKCDQKTYVNPQGQSFAYTIPWAKTYKVLAAKLDGSVGFVPTTEAWEVSHIEGHDPVTDLE